MFARKVSLQLKPNSVAEFTQRIEKGKLPNTAAFCGLCGCHHGDSGFSLYQSQNRDSLRRQQASHFRL
jgi:hypothetical protein